MRREGGLIQKASRWRRPRENFLLSHCEQKGGKERETKRQRSGLGEGLNSNEGSLCSV